MIIMGVAMNMIMGKVIMMRMMTFMLLTYGNLRSPALLNVRPDDRDVVVVFDQTLQPDDVLLGHNNMLLLRGDLHVQLLRNVLLLRPLVLVHILVARVVGVLVLVGGGGEGGDEVDGERGDDEEEGEEGGGDHLDAAHRLNNSASNQCHSLVEVNQAIK